MIACSPFRHERRPSFSVNLDTGLYIDFGMDDEFWGKGNFIKLLAWLRNESFEETEEYLISTYSPQFGDVDRLQLPDISDWLDTDRNNAVFDRSDLKPFLYKHPYLERRGIPFIVQRAFDVGYDPSTKSVVLVWHDKDGNIVSWKHRHVHSKNFWYVRGGQPIRNHLYGIHWVVRKKAKKVWIVEGEIDALTLWAKGRPAVALGTSLLSDAKRDLILKTGIEQLIIATDNDKVGEKAKRTIVKSLAGLIDLYEVDWNSLDDYCKDINDARDKLEDLKIKPVDHFDWDGF